MHDIYNIIHVYDPFLQMVRNLSSLNLIYIVFNAYHPIQLQIFKELQRNRTMSNIKHRAFTKVVTYLTKPLTVSSKTFILDVWQGAE